MSLTGLSRIAVFIVLAMVAAWSGREYALPLASYLADARNSTARDTKIADRSLAYRLPAEGPLTFAFSQPVEQAKILVHPAVTEEVRNRPEGFVYGLRLRWFGATGEELSVHDIYLQADAPDAVFASGMNWRFFRTRPELVAEQDQIIAESPSPAVRLQLEEIERDLGMVGVDLRVYERRPFLGSQSIAAFQRLSEGDKRTYTEPNAFPADMLTREEMFYLGKNLWRPVGPVGIAGRDYEALVLYEAVLSPDNTIIGGMQ